MKLSGKCKEDFDTWLNPMYLEEVETGSHITVFEYVGNEMRYGVYVDFFNSVDIRIEITNEFDKILNYNRGFNTIVNNIQLFFNNDCFESRPEARAAAIEKANQIYNNKN